MMNRNRIILMLLLLLYGIPGRLQARPLTFRISEKYGSRQILFESKAPVENIEGRVVRFTGVITLDPSKKDLGLKVNIRHNVKDMTTGVALRDKHLHSAKWLDGARHPRVEFTLAPTSKQKVKKKGKNKWFVEATGKFYLKGKVKTITAPVDIRLKRTKKGMKLIARGGFKINLKEFGIHGPRAMKYIGVRVGENVNIRFKFVSEAN